MNGSLVSVIGLDTSYLIQGARPWTMNFRVDDLENYDTTQVGKSTKKYIKSYLPVLLLITTQSVSRHHIDFHFLLHCPQGSLSHHDDGVE